MPSDLSQRFEQLRREPLGVGLPSPEELRREGTTRRRMRRAAAAGVAAAAVAVVALTLNAVLATPQGLTPPPGLGSPTSDPSPTRTTPTRTTPTRTTPTETATAEPSRTLSLIPDSAFPVHEALGFRSGGFASGGFDVGTRTSLPGVCGLVSADVDGQQELTATADLIANRWESSTIDVPDPPDQLAPEGYMHIQILLFDDGGAARFLESLRTAIAACRTDPQAQRGPITFTAPTGAPMYGDDTFTFIATWPYPVQPNSSETFPCDDLYEVIRVGEAVMFAYVGGWETCYADPALDREVRDVSIAAFLDWAARI